MCVSWGRLTEGEAFWLKDDVLHRILLNLGVVLVIPGPSSNCAGKRLLRLARYVLVLETQGGIGATGPSGRARMCAWACGRGPVGACARAGTEGAAEGVTSCLLASFFFVASQDFFHTTSTPPTPQKCIFPSASQEKHEPRG
jgi:hypothetical protein